MDVVDSTVSPSKLYLLIKFYIPIFPRAQCVQEKLHFRVVYLRCLACCLVCKDLQTIPTTNRSHIHTLCREQENSSLLRCRSGQQDPGAATPSLQQRKPLRVAFITRRTETSVNPSKSRVASTVRWQIMARGREGPYFNALQSSLQCLLWELSCADALSEEFRPC